MHVKVELPFQVVGAEFPKTTPLLELYETEGKVHRILGFVPGNDRREADLPHAREDGESGKYERRPYPFVLVKGG